MRFPWNNNKTAAPAMTREDVEAIAQASARAEAQEIVGAAAETALERMGVERAEVMSPIPMPSLSPGGGKYPLYAFDNAINYATPVAPQRRPGSIVSVQTLRQMADNYDVLRSCIQHLKREVGEVPIAFVPLDEKDTSRKTQKAIAAATKFFSTPGGLGGAGNRRSHFEGMMIEDVCIVGAGATWFNTTLGGGLAVALPIDAATIRPKVDAYGWPGPGDYVYEQYTFGVKVTEFKRSELTYDGVYPRSYTPFFASPVEWLLNVINSALRADDWNRRWLTDGSAAGEMLALPEGWTPDMIKEYTLYWDALLAGDSAQRQKMRMVPYGSNRVGSNSRKDQDFQEFELWLLRRTCSLMGVQPASVGFAGEQYKVSQTDSMESTSQFGAGVLLEFRKAQYDDILSRMGYGDLIECQNVTAREEDASKRAIRNVALVSGGIKTLNEARLEEGLDADPDGDVLLVSNMLVPITQAVAPPPPPPAATPADPGNTGGNTPGDNNGRPAAAAADSARVAGVPTNAVVAGGARFPQVIPADITLPLSQWQRKALRSLQRGSGAGVPFTDASLPTALCASLTAILPSCDSPAAVRSLFRSAHLPSVYLVRHAPTKLSGSAVIGWLNPGLSGDGKDKAKDVAKWFVGLGVEQIKTSDLKRCVQTSKILSSACGAPVTMRSRDLRAWNLGEWQGQDTNAFRPILDDYVRYKPDIPISGGESFNDFAGRFLPALQAALNDVKDGEPQTMIVCAHSPCMKVALAWIAATPGADSIDLSALDPDLIVGSDIPAAGVIWIRQTDTGWSTQMIDIDAVLAKQKGN